MNPPPIIRPCSHVASGETTGLMFWCPGCETYHSVRTDPGGWTFNGDMEKPTINPSILVNGRDGSEGVRCHSYVRGGMIKFLPDCDHKLAGQTVPLPPDPYEEV